MVRDVFQYVAVLSPLAVPWIHFGRAQFPWGRFSHCRSIHQYKPFGPPSEFSGKGAAGNMIPSARRRAAVTTWRQKADSGRSRGVGRQKQPI
jgi:hypothetical protein